MRGATFVLLAGVLSVVLAEGQFYVPRAYYTIDSAGHASDPVPLRRLRRSISPIPYMYGGGASAIANANAQAQGWSGADASAVANANAIAGAGGGGGWGAPRQGGYGASRPSGLGQVFRQAGPVNGRSVSASTSVGMDSSGSGYYDQTASVYP